MPFAFVSKQIGGRNKPPLFDDRQFSRDLQRAVKSRAQAMKRDYERVVATWDDKPVFEQITQTTRPDISVLVGTDDRIFGYLDRGTRVRRALMSPDFSPKTRPGELRSYPGQGEVVFVSKKLNLPGIKARGWSKMIGKKHKKPFQRDVLAALKAARKRSKG